MCERASLTPYNPWMTIGWCLENCWMTPGWFWDEFWMAEKIIRIVSRKINNFETGTSCHVKYWNSVAAKKQQQQNSFDIRYQFQHDDMSKWHDSRKRQETIF